VAKANGDFTAFVAGYALKDKFPSWSQPASRPGAYDVDEHLYRVFSGRISVSDALQGLFANPATFVSEFAKLRGDVLKARRSTSSRRRS